jgi:hypothetical protein
MNIKELKEIIQELPDEMPVGLLDYTTDDFYDCNYNLKKEDFFIEDYVFDEDSEILGKMLFIGFENKLNENPI